MGTGVTKLCGVCGETKAIEQFALRSDSGGRRHLCNKCKHKKYGGWKRKNPAKAKVIQRRTNLKAWGLTMDDFAKMLDEQGGVCAICKHPSTRKCHRTGHPYPLVVDHDHATGKIRGLLCDKCNRAIGLLRDSVDVLEKAIAYLERA